MNKLEYLRKALNNQVSLDLAWVVSMVAMTRPKEDMTGKEEPIYLSVSRRDWGVGYIGEEAKLEKIEDSKPDEPLFKFTDIIEVDSTWAPNITGTTSTTFGNLIFNRIAIVPAFNDKFPFLTGKITVDRVSEIIVPKLRSTPGELEERKRDLFYVDEYIQFTNGLGLLEGLSMVASIAATPKSIVPPPGIDEYRQGLIEEYGDRLQDPVVLAEFEGKLKDYDDAYLKDDPAYGKFLSGKVKNISRKKLFLTIGSEDTMVPEMKPTVITTSLNDGWSTDPKEFVSMMNGVRAGSYSRGTETIKGGVSAKYLLRAANNYTILDRDCGSKLGLTRVYNTGNVKQLVGRSVILNGKSTLVENSEQAKNYLGRPTIIRSPMYCKEEGENLCRVCAGENLMAFPTGLTIPLTEVSSIILIASLKRMHGSVLKTAELDLEHAFS